MSPKPLKQLTTEPDSILCEHPEGGNRRLYSDGGEHDEGQPGEEEVEKRWRKNGGGGGMERAKGNRDSEGGWGMRAMGVGCQSGSGGGG